MLSQLDISDAVAEDSDDAATPSGLGSPNAKTSSMDYIHHPPPHPPPSSLSLTPLPFLLTPLFFPYPSLSPSLLFLLLPSPFMVFPTFPFLRLPPSPPPLSSPLHPLSLSLSLLAPGLQTRHPNMACIYCAMSSSPLYAGMVCMMDPASQSAMHI